jgi:hypothetical protein
MSRLLFAKRSRRLRFSLYLNYGFQRTSDVKIAKTDAVTVRLDPELKGRLTQAATKLDLSENNIVRHALHAAMNAIEANDYKIELPLEMALAKTPINKVAPILAFLIISSSRCPLTQTYSNLCQRVRTRTTRLCHCRAFTILGAVRYCSMAAVWPVSTNGTAVVALRPTFISGIFADFVNGSSFISRAKNALFCSLFKFSNGTAAMLSPAGQDSELMPEARRTVASYR